MTELLDLFRHLPEHLQLWAQSYGVGFYAILTAMIFAETGLVVTPFLPGDSLLFAAGTVLALHPEGLHLSSLAILLSLAAIAGDSVNYAVGRLLAPKVESLRWINRRHLEKTRDFYDRHGGKTILFARFVPIVRTYAPFVAGLTGMNYRQFGLFNIAGGILWINAFLALGYFFGNIPHVKSHFQYVVGAIIILSLLPIVIEYFKARKTHT